MTLIFMNFGKKYSNIGDKVTFLVLYAKN